MPNEDEKNPAAPAASADAPKEPAAPAAPAAPVAPAAPAPKGEGSLPDWAVQERKTLRDEAEQARTHLQEERDKWNGGKTAAEVAALEAQIHALQAEVVVVEAGHPRELATRIKGNSQDELRADMQALVGSLPSGRRKAGGLTPGDNNSGESVQERVARLRK